MRQPDSKKALAAIFRADLLRGAFYLLLLLAVCVIPFAFGQRDIARVSKRSTSANMAQLSVTSSDGDRDASALPMLEFSTGGVFWNQYNNNPATEPPINIGSQKFEPAMTSFDDQAAGDFVLTAPPPPMFAYINDVRVMGEYSQGGGPASIEGATPTPTSTMTPVACQLFENFDFVTPPALPGGWTAINGINPDGILWQTSNSGLPSPPAHSPPNAAWVNDPAVISDKYLDSPPIRFQGFEYGILTFRNNYSLEDTRDGGVLEVSIDGGPFLDILAAGGVFTQGGYNATISTCCGNPLAGRQAWTGSSGGFITTTVNLHAFENSTIVLRWHMGSDSSTSGQGWRIDTLQITCINGTPTPTATATATATASPTPIGCGLFQSFDMVNPPVLPADWIATNGINPDGLLWQSSNSGQPSPPADSLPNAAWVNDPAAISDKYLDSPHIVIEQLENAALMFRNNYALQTDFDGGVLEISIDGGTFQDIIAAGGSFLQGGYNGTISNCCGNPLAGRQAWTGSSDGFITTAVDLDSFQGHTIVLRWRMGSDSDFAGQGWRIDSVQMICERPTPTPTPTATPQPSATPTATATPTVPSTARSTPTPRPRPTPAPRP